MNIRKNAVMLIACALVVLPLTARVSTAHAEDEIKNGQVFKAGKDSKEPEMVRIPGKDYEIGKYEVTQAEWRAVMGSNPPELKFGNCGDTCPVDSVSWNDAQEFIQKLNAETGKQYRLPTEAEWKYACYGDSQTKYCGGNDLDAVAWFYGNSNSQTHPAGQKQANSHGLYDLSGNVWEWVNDCYNENCAERVLRGGSWYDDESVLLKDRSGEGSDIRDGNFGFRVARTLP